jgi:hypothetical protein
MALIARRRFVLSGLPALASSAALAACSPAALLTPTPAPKSAEAPNPPAWASDVRTALVLGIVGAGGLGFELQMAMRLFRYQETLMILALMIAVVTALDWGSSRLRARTI